MPFTFTQINTKKFMRFHQARHIENVDVGSMNISYDGVSANKSSGRTFEVLSGKFDKCRVVYPLCVGMAETGFTSYMKAQNVMRSTLCGLKDLGVHIQYFIMDHPKRCSLRGQKACGSYYGCDLCFRRAIRSTPKTPTDSRKKSKGACMVYPVSNDEHPLRSHQRHLELAQRAHPELDGGPNDYYGVKEGVNFLIETLPDLDIVNDVIIDYMHNCLLGKVFNMTLCM